MSGGSSGLARNVLSHCTPMLSKQCVQHAVHSAAYLGVQVKQGVRLVGENLCEAYTIDTEQ